MNKARRKEIYTVINRLNSLCDSIKKQEDIDLLSVIEDIAEDVDFIFSDEEYCKDNIPENLQNGYRFFMVEEACDNLEYAKDSLEEIEEDDDIDSIIKSIDEAIRYLNNATD